MKDINLKIEVSKDDFRKKLDIKDGHTPTKDELESIIKPLIPKSERGARGEKGVKGDKGDAGKDGKPGKDGKDGAPGKNGIDGKDAIPDTGTQIIEKINPLKNVLDFKVLKNIPDFALQRDLPQGGMGGGGGPTILFQDEGTNITDNPVTKLNVTGAGGSITYSGSGVATLNISGTVDGSGTANQITYWVDSDTLGALATTTYPSLTELSYVKGVTSSIQTQLDGKQATGNYITALTGDATASGPGSVALTLATVNSNVGTFGSATQASQLTVNAKGLITAVSNVTITPAASSITGAGNLTAGSAKISIGGTGTGATLTNVSVDLGSVAASDLSNGVTGSGSIVLATNPTLTGITFTAGNDIRPTADSTTAINIAQADGTDFVIFDTSNKRVGIGTTPTYSLHIAGITNEARTINSTLTSNANGCAAIYGTLTDTAVTADGGFSRSGIVADYTATPASASNRDGHGILGIARTEIGGSVNTGAIYGMRFTAQNRGTATATSLTGAYAYPYSDSTGTTTTATGYRSSLWIIGGGTYTTWNGILIDKQTVTGTITNLRGLAINDYTDGTNNTLIGVGTLTTGNWGLYINSTKDNFFAGDITMTAGLNIRPSSDSTTAINIAQTDGTNFVTFDTTNKKVGIGTTPSEMLHLEGANAVRLLIKTTGNVAATDTANLRLDRGGTSAYANVAYMTAGVQRWFTGLWSGSENFVIRDQDTNKEVFTLTDGLPTNSFLIAADGSVGIGTATPTSLLQVGAVATTKSAPTTTGAWLGVPAATLTDSSTAASGTAATGTFISFAQPTYAASNTSVTVTDAATVYIANAPTAGTNVTLTNAYALWVDAGKTRFDGIVDIRDNSPQLIGTSAIGYDTVIYQSGTGGGGQNVFKRADGTKESPTDVLSGMALGSFSFRGYTNGAFTGSKAYITAEANQNWSSTANGTRIVFSTTPNNSTTLTGGLQLHSDQGVGIATWLRVGDHDTAPTNVTAGDLTITRLQLGGSAAFSESSGLAFQGSNNITTAISTTIGFNLTNSITMAVDNAQQIRTLNMENTINATSAGVGTLYAGYFINRYNGADDATTLVGNFTSGFFAGSAGINFGTVGTAIAAQGVGINIFSNSQVGTITTGIGAHYVGFDASNTAAITSTNIIGGRFRGANSANTGVSTIATVTGIQVLDNVKGSANVTMTTTVGVDIAAQTKGTNNTNLLIGTVATGTWSIYNNSSSNNAHSGNTRFGGVTAPTVAVDVTGAVLATTTIKSSGATSGIGYATGAGGAVTQATSRTTGVTLNKVCGAITLVSAAGSATPATFTVTNSAVAATDTIVVCQKSGTDLYNIHVTAVAAGSFNISFWTTGGTTTEQPVFNFAIIKAVAA